MIKDNSALTFNPLNVGQGVEFLSDNEHHNTLQVWLEEYLGDSDPNVIYFSLTSKNNEEGLSFTISKKEAKILANYLLTII